MNKTKVDKLLPEAYEALENFEIASKGKIDKKFRSYISTYGAAITMGSLLSATAFFSAKGSAAEDRYKLLNAIYYLIAESGKSVSDIKNYDLFNYIKDKEKTGEGPKVKEEVINAAIALKLAMNLYELK